MALKIKLSSKQLEILKDCRISRRYNPKFKSIPKLIELGFIAREVDSVRPDGTAVFRITDAGRAWLDEEAEEVEKFAERWNGNLRRNQ